MPILETVERAVDHGGLVSALIVLVALIVKAVDRERQRRALLATRDDSALAKKIEEIPPITTLLVLAFGAALASLLFGSPVIVARQDAREVWAVGLSKTCVPACKAGEICYNGKCTATAATMADLIVPAGYDYDPTQSAAERLSVTQ